MAKFNAGEQVERLEYDFEDFGGPKGFVTEPSTGTVNRFFKNMKSLLKEVRRIQKEVEGDDHNEEEEMSDEDALTAMKAMDENEEAIDIMQAKTVEYLAELCGATRDPDTGDLDMSSGSPSGDALSKLPYRVLQAFSQWLMEQIKPKRTTPGTRN